MNVYEAHIWCRVKHNGEFSHNGQRFELIHALNEERARKQIVLADSKTWGEGTQRVDIASEFIYSIEKTGTVKKQMYYVYSNGRSPRPCK